MTTGGFRYAVAVFVGLTAMHSAFADTILFKTGQVISGTLMQTNTNSVCFRRDYATFNYPAEAVRGLIIDENAFRNAAHRTNRLSDWETIVSKVAAQPWAARLRQIPATVIDSGTFKHVPYSSFRAGTSYELNIFGEQENPVAVQITIGSGLVNDPVARENCVAIIAAIVREPNDRDAVLKLKRTEDVCARDGLIFQVTSPTKGDASVTWSIAVYDEKRIVSAQTGKDVQKMTFSGGEVSASLLAFDPNDPKWIIEQRKPSLLQTVRHVASDKKAPPLTTAKLGASAATSVSTNHGGTNTASVTNLPAVPPGSIYVRGYYRKDGTYVRPHIRKR